MVQKTLLVGNTIDVGVERFKIPELIFQPHLLPSLGLGDDAPELKMADGSPLRGLPSLILENINKCDVDVRKDLFGGMLLAGGGSLFGSLRERLEADLHDAAPTNVRVKAGGARPFFDCAATRRHIKPPSLALFCNRSPPARFKKNNTCSTCLLSPLRKRLSNRETYASCGVCESCVVRRVN